MTPEQRSEATYLKLEGDRLAGRAKDDPYLRFIIRALVFIVMQVAGR